MQFDASDCFLGGSIRLQCAEHHRKQRWHPRDPSECRPNDCHSSTSHSPSHTADYLYFWGKTYQKSRTKNHQVYVFFATVLQASHRSIPQPILDVNGMQLGGGKVRKPGRNALTFLIVINLAFWNMNVRTLRQTATTKAPFKSQFYARKSLLRTA